MALPVICVLAILLAHKQRVVSLNPCPTALVKRLILVSEALVSGSVFLLTSGAADISAPLSSLAWLSADLVRHAGLQLAIAAGRAELHRLYIRAVRSDLTRTKLLSIRFARSGEPRTDTYVVSAAIRRRAEVNAFHARSSSEPVLLM